MLVHGHEHVCQVVRDEASLRSAMAEFLQGLDGRVGIFVHRYPEAEAWRRLEAAGPAASLRESGRLVAVGREQAFQAGGPRIHHDHVAAVVQDSLDAAKAKGLGLSILADASHAYFQEGRSQEWFAFESWLGARLAHDVALVCLYWEGDLQDPAILDGMMRTHLSRLGSSSVYPIDPGA